METNETLNADLFEENHDQIDQNEDDEEIEMAEIDVVNAEIQNIDVEHPSQVMEVKSYTLR